MEFVLKVNEYLRIDFTDCTLGATTLNESDLIPGIYDYQSSQNFDNYLKELGVDYVLRKLAGLASPVVTISTNCQENLSNVSIKFI